MVPNLGVANSPLFKYSTVTHDASALHHLLPVPNCLKRAYTTRCSNADKSICRVLHQLVDPIALRQLVVETWMELFGDEEMS